MDIRQNPGKAGIEHVRKFNKSMEDTMNDDDKRVLGIAEGLLDVVQGHPRTTKKGDTEGVLAGPVCPQCEIPTQLHEGAETCPVHGKVLIDA